MFLTGRLPILVALGVVPVVLLSLAGGPAWLAAVGWLALCAVLAGVDAVAAPSPRALEFSRDLPARTRLGELVAAGLRVRNGGSRRIHGLLRDAWQPTAGAPLGRIRIDLPAGEQETYTVPLLPRRRGELRSEFVVVRSSGPLGLAGRQTVITAPGALRVLPPFTARRHLPPRLARLREHDGSTSVQMRGAGTEFDSLREYVRGDDVRSIDWRATARKRDPASGGATLVVRTWRPERDRRVVIVVDSGRTSAARVADEPRIDTAFEASLLLAALASRAGDRVDLIVFDRVVRGRVQGLTGAQLLSRMVDAMAPIEPQLIETDWDAIPTLVRQVTTHRALVVLLTSIDAPGASRGLLSMLPQLTRRHTVVVASVSDPDVLAAGRERADTEQVYRAAAAERALLDAARVAAAIRQSGGEVVTGAPAELPPALADAYLALKAAGRL